MAVLVVSLRYRVVLELERHQCSTIGSRGKNYTLAGRNAAPLDLAEVEWIIRDRRGRKNQGVANA